MPGRYPAATLPLPCRCHAGRHVALPCQCPVNARPPPCRYHDNARPMHGRCTAGAMPPPRRLSSWSALPSIPLPCGILPLPGRHLANARPVSRWYLLPMHGRHVYQLPAQGHLACTWALLCQYTAAVLLSSWPPPRRYLASIPGRRLAATRSVTGRHLAAT